MAKKEESNTALLDPPKEEPKAVAPEPKKPAPWVMPKPDIDGVVQWHPRGERSSTQRAYVVAVFNERVRLFVPTERLAPMKTCMHVDDPNVTEKPDAVKEESAGTWEHSVQEKRLQDRDAYFTRELLACVEKCNANTKLVEQLVDSVKSLELRLSCK